MRSEQFKIYHPNWHQLKASEIDTLFKVYLPSDVTAYPYALIPDLIKLQKATVILVQNRTRSAVYIIREIYEKYQVPTGMSDDLIKNYPHGKPVFRVQPFEIPQIHRLKEPCFFAQYHPVTKKIFDVHWIGIEPSDITAASILKKAKWFLVNEVK